MWISNVFTHDPVLSVAAIWDYCVLTEAQRKEE